MKNTKSLRYFCAIISLFSLSAGNMYAASTFDLSNTKVDHATPSGTEVGAFSNVVNAKYTLVSGTGNEDNSRFTIDGDKLKLNFTPDYTSPVDLGDTANNNTYSIRVQQESAINFSGMDIFDTDMNTDFNSDENDYPSAPNPLDVPVNLNGDVAYGGYFNSPNFGTEQSFAILIKQSEVRAWGDSNHGGSGAPTGKGFKKIYSNRHAYAALRDDGSIVSWGNPNYGGTGAPTGTGYQRVYSTYNAFATLKNDGSVKVWGDKVYGGAYTDGGSGYNVYAGAPTGTGYTKIYSNRYAFAALKNDGSISVWGNKLRGGSSVDKLTPAYLKTKGAPTDNGYTKIYASEKAFAALKSDGSITSWGDWWVGGTGAPTDNGYTKIYSNSSVFVATKPDGTIKVWGYEESGGKQSKVDNLLATLTAGEKVVKIYSNDKAFAFLTNKGNIKVWGDKRYGGTTNSGSNLYQKWQGAPTDSGYTKIYSNQDAFAALKNDGSITVWGNISKGGSFIDGYDNYMHVHYKGAPSGTGYTKIYSNLHAFAALKNDGSITVWGAKLYGGDQSQVDAISLNTGEKYVQIYSNEYAFLALTNQGHLKTWGYKGKGASQDIIDKFTLKSEKNFIITVEIKKNTLSYNANTGTGTMANESHTGSTTFNLTANTFTKTGYTFNGWNTQADGSGSGYTDQASFTIPSLDTTLYAQWIANTDTAYKVEHYLQNSNGTTYPIVANPIETLTGTTDMVVDAGNRTFTGYTYENSNTDNIQTGTILANGSLVLKRYYTINTYTLTFEENGGSTVADQTDIAYNTTATEPTDPTRTGYTFNGWYTDNTTFANQFDFTTPITQDINLYAQWTIISTPITICDDNTATNYNSATGSHVTVDNSTCTYPTPTPTPVCKDINATNYDSSTGSHITTDNSLCIYREKACKNQNATNYDSDPNKDIDNTLCKYKETNSATGPGGGYDPEREPDTPKEGTILKKVWETANLITAVNTLEDDNAKEIILNSQCSSLIRDISDLKTQAVYYKTFIQNESDEYVNQNITFGQFKRVLAKYNTNLSHTGTISDNIQSINKNMNEGIERSIAIKLLVSSLQNRYQQSSTFPLLPTQEYITTYTDVTPTTNNASYIQQSYNLCLTHGRKTKQGMPTNLQTGQIDPTAPRVFEPNDYITIAETIKVLVNMSYSWDRIKVLTNG